MKMTAFFSFIISVVIIFATAIGLQICQNKDFLDKIEGYQSATIVSYEEVDCTGRIVKNGKLNYYTFQNNKEFDKINNYEGVVFYFSKETKLDFFEDICSFAFTQPSKVEDMNVYYGFCPDFSKFVLHENKKVNFQLAEREGDWVLGFPLILTGF